MPIPLIIGGLLAGAAGVMGAGMSWAASEDNKEAKEILEDAKYKYDNKKSQFDKKQKSTQDELEKLALLKTDVWVSFDRFIQAFEKIKNKPNLSGMYTIDELNLSTGEFIKEIKALSVSASSIVAGSATAAVMTGLAIGGTSLVLGSGGAMAVATTVACEVAAGAVTASTVASIATPLALVAGPALFVGGLSNIDKSSQNLDNAKKTEKEVDKACTSMNKSIELFNKITKCSKNLYSELKILSELYQEKVTQLENLVATKTNYNQLTNQEKQLLNANILMVKLLKELTQVEIVKVKEDNETQYVDETTVNSVIESCKQKKFSFGY